MNLPQRQTEIFLIICVARWRKFFNAHLQNSFFIFKFLNLSFKQFFVHFLFVKILCKILSTCILDIYKTLSTLIYLFSNVHKIYLPPLTSVLYTIYKICPLRFLFLTFLQFFLPVWFCPLSRPLSTTLAKPPFSIFTKLFLPSLN